MSSTPQDELSAHERALLDGGQHDGLARELAKRDRPDLAGWVLEQIWDWEGAGQAYQAAKLPVDALRVAVEAGTASAIDPILAQIEREHDPKILDAALLVLRKRRRSMDVARLLALRDDPLAQAAAQVRAGDRLGAAVTLANSDHPKQALDVLRAGGALESMAGHAHAAHSLAASLAWDLGDAEGAAKAAQAALRCAQSNPEAQLKAQAKTQHDQPDADRHLLARALDALGHDLAAHMVLRGRDVDDTAGGLPGRYRVTGLGPSGLIGTTYVGIDRVTLEEVEVQLLLVDHGDSAPIEPAVLKELEAFAAVANAATRIGHPAIRPILRLDPAAGLLVTPRAQGASLSTLIRPPGMLSMVSRARGLVAFLLEGLMAAHARGLVHGWLLPSLIVCDVAGRPMLGPFGANHLAGLNATHTGGLEELLAISAPEVQRGEPPTPASDLYAVGVLLGALLTGRLQRMTEALVTSPELELAAALCAEHPQDRATADHALQVLRAPIADVQELGNTEAETTAERSTAAGRALDEGLVVLAAESWSEELLDALCQSNGPWMQPILDREERRLVLAPWPQGCRSLGSGALDQWRKLLDPAALHLLSPALETAIATRLQPSSLVHAAGGSWMLALDDLLSR